MAKEVKARKIKKVTEKAAQLEKTKSLFYPDEYGDEEGAHKACSYAAAGESVYWDRKAKAWYYYL